MGVAERREREKEQRRDEILDAAKALFFEQGYDGTTMVKIAERLELGKGTIYLSFPSKEHLAHEILIGSFDALICLVDEAAATESLGVAKLRAMAGAYVAFYENQFREFYFWQMLEGVLHEALAREDFGPAFGERFDALKQIVVDALEQGLADTSLRNDLHPELSAVTYMFAVDGVMRQLITRSALFKRFMGFSEEVVIEELFRILIHSLE